MTQIDNATRELSGTGTSSFGDRVRDRARTVCPAPLRRWYWKGLGRIRHFHRVTRRYARMTPEGLVSDIKKQVAERRNAAFLKETSITREEFIGDIRNAIAERRGYAAGKIGISQKFWMFYELYLDREKNPTKVRKFEEELKFHCLNQEGIFPARPDFILEFNRFYMRHVKNLDSLGICYTPATMETDLIEHYGLKSKLMYYRIQEPAETDNPCYLPYFRNKKLLIVCPFGELLKQRATKDTFEGVWDKFDKKWFAPSGVEAIEFPYGFSPATHKQYPTVLELFTDISQRIERKDFDVALIAAGGLAIPIASHIKSMGKVAIDLGGHLQFLFGVRGKRWRKTKYQHYFNDWWIDMPAQYRPKETGVCDNGAYW